MKINQRASVIAPIAGLLLGFFDFVWIKFMPALVAGLGNSVAAWAVAAFLLTYFFRWPGVRTIAGAVIMLVLAVPSYYAAAALIQNDNWSNMWGPSSPLWMALTVIAGVVFGGAGVLGRERGPLRLAAPPPSLVDSEHRYITTDTVGPRTQPHPLTGASLWVPALGPDEAPDWRLIRPEATGDPTVRTRSSGSHRCCYPPVKCT